MAKVGDVVEIAGRKVGEAAREGKVVAVTGSMLRIRWTSGEESSLIPGPGTMTVVATGRPAAKKSSPSAKKAAPAKKAGKATKKKAAPKKAPAPKKAAKKAKAPTKKTARKSAKKATKSTKKRR